VQIVFLAFLVVFVVSLWGRRRFQAAYEEERSHQLSCGISGREVIEEILKIRGIEVVEIVSGRGFLVDVYEPAKKRIVLAPQHYGGTTFSAVAVSAQLAGKVLQHRDKYAPLTWRHSAIWLTLSLSLPILMIALVSLLFSKVIFLVTLLIWTLVTGYNVVTMPVEMDAALRAKEALKKVGIFRNFDERYGVERVMKLAGAAKIEGIFYVISWLFIRLPHWLKSKRPIREE